MKNQSNAKMYITIGIILMLVVGFIAYKKFNNLLLNSI